jgi:putative hemolysin
MAKSVRGQRIEQAVSRKDLQRALPDLQPGTLFKRQRQKNSRSAWDPDFHCADLFLLLSLDRMEGRYARSMVLRLWLKNIKAVIRLS